MRRLCISVAGRRFCRLQSRLVDGFETRSSSKLLSTPLGSRRRSSNQGGRDGAGLQEATSVGAAFGRGGEDERGTVSNGGERPHAYHHHHGKEAVPAGQTHVKVSLRHLERLLKPERRQLWFAAAAILVGSLSSMAVPAIFGSVVDALSTSSSAATAVESRDVIQQMGVALVGVTLVGGAATFVRVSILDIVGQRVGRNLRKELFGNLLRQDLAFFHQSRSMELANRLSTDVHEVAEHLVEAVAGLMTSSLTAIAASACLVYTSPKLAAVTLFVVPVLAGGALIYGRYVKTLSRKLLNALAASTQMAAERFANIRTVWAYSAEAREHKAYSKVIDNSYGYARSLALLEGGYVGTIFLVSNGTLLAVLVLGADMVLAGDMTVGALASFCLYAHHLNDAISDVTESVSGVIRAQGAGGRLFSLLERKPGEAPPPSTDSMAFDDNAALTGKEGGRGPVAAAAPAAAAAAAPAVTLGAIPEWAPPVAQAGPKEAVKAVADAAKAVRHALERPHKNPAESEDAEGLNMNSGKIVLPEPLRGNVELRDVVFAYPTRPHQRVFDGLTLRLREGEVVALTGESGCGKSTVGLLLEGLYRIQRGEVLIGGFDVSELDQGVLRRNLLAVSQSPALFAGTVRYNIAFGRPDASMEEVIEAARTVGAHDFIEKLSGQYETEIGERGVALSGGQAQRLALARAVLIHPRVLILDEATSALDQETEDRVQSAVLRAMRGSTCLLITHHSNVMRMADRVCVLRRGKIFAEGSFEELCRPGGPLAAMMAAMGGNGSRGRSDTAASP